jgi:transcription elongation factor Elf1
MLTITPIEKSEITKLICPKCNERVPRIGLLKDSTISGLTFTCKGCGGTFKVTTK